jgi:hypothetical protein
MVVCLSSAAEGFLICLSMFTAEQKSCTFHSLMLFIYFLQMNKKLAHALKYAMSQMSDTAKKLQDTTSFCYTDEDVVDGFMMTQVARSMDELAEILEVTSIDC